MKRLFIPIVALSVVSIGSTPSARAQDAALMPTCESWTVHPLERIRACTAVILSDALKNVRRDAYLNRAKARVQRAPGDVRALFDFNEAIRLGVGTVDARGMATLYVARGEAHAFLGQFDLALGDATVAIQHDPGFAAAHALRGESLRHLARATARRQGTPDNDNLARSLAAYTEAIRLYPDVAAGYHGRALVHIETGDLDRAIGELTEAIRLKPSPTYFETRALAFRLKGDAAKQKADRAEMARLNSEAARLAAPDPLRRCESESDLLRKPDEVVRACTAVIQSRLPAPLRAAAYVGRGLALKEKDDHDGAIVNFTQALGIDPLYTPAYEERAQVFSLKEQHDRAIADFTEAIRLEPTFWANYLHRAGVLFYNKDDVDRAIADYTEAINLLPTQAVPYLLRADAYRKKGDIARADADAAEAKRLSALETERNRLLKDDRKPSTPAAQEPAAQSPVEQELRLLKRLLGR